jgi:N-formylglutamate amidohydrolase
MAIAINHEMAVELGLGNLTSAQERQFLDRFNAVLELRVGRKIAGIMSLRHLDEFERLSEGAGDTPNVEEARSLLEDIFPDYDATVRAEYRYMRQEIAAAASDLLSKTLGEPDEAF